MPDHRLSATVHLLLSALSTLLLLLLLLLFIRFIFLLFPPLFTVRRPTMGWMISDFHFVCILTSPLLPVRYCPTGMRSSFTLSIHLFRCLPLIRILLLLYVNLSLVFIRPMCPNHRSLRSRSFFPQFRLQHATFRASELLPSSSHIGAAAACRLGV